MMVKGEHWKLGKNRWRIMGHSDSMECLGMLIEKDDVERGR
jgi:hypothetical protein